MNSGSSKLWDIYALADYLSVPPSWVYNRARRQEIPHIKLGRYYRFDPESLEFKSWLDSVRLKGYDSHLNKKDGPDQEDPVMARASYQKGRIEQRERKNGLLWVLRYRLRQGTKWIEKTEELGSFKGEKEARKAADLKMVEINHLNSKSRTRTVTVAEFVSGLWQNYVNKLKPSTLYSYQSMLKTYVLPAWAHRSMDSMMPEDVTLFLSARESEGLSSKYRLNLYSLLNVLFEVAVEYDLIASNPVRRKLHRPKIEKSEKPALNAEQIRSAIAAASEQYRSLLLCVAMTGLRLGELLALRWMNVDFSSSRLTVTHNLWRGKLVSPKTEGSKRALHLTQTLSEILRAHQHGSLWDKSLDYVFCNEEGKPLDPDYLRNQVLYPALEAAGIPRGDRTHGFHLFRHSAATILDEQTRSLRAAQELLGHSRESTTAGYTHTERVAEEATEILAREIVGTCGLTVAESWVKLN